MTKTELVPQAIYDSVASQPLLADDISKAVLFALGTPPHVQIAELTIRPLGEAY